MNLNKLETFFWGGVEEGETSNSSIIADFGILSSNGIKSAAISAVGKQNFAMASPIN